MGLFNSGLIFQWLSHNQNNNVRTATLPIAYETQHLQAFATINIMSEHGISAYDKTLTTVSTVAGNGNPKSIFSIGY